MEKRLIPWVLFALFFPALLPAGEAGVFPLWPDAPLVEPGQRSLDAIAVIPTREEECPVCGRIVDVPLVDALMRRSAGAGTQPRWHMDAQRRDTDMAPVPRKNRVRWQADIVVCPDCGLSLPADDFSGPVPPALSEWVTSTLRPNMRLVQKTLLGKRADEMSDEQIIDFFNRQEEIPDTIRTEHFRIYSIAADQPFAMRAKASWLSAWALRRASAGLCAGAFLRARQEAVEKMLAEKRLVDASGRIEELRRLLGKNRAGKDRLSYADGLGAWLLLAGEHIHSGLYREAEEIISRIREASRERFLKPEQDPLWPSTTGRAARAFRLNELESMRTDMDNELSVVLEQIRLERELLGNAAGLLRKAVLADEIHDPDLALFYAYMIGEMLRRHGEFPLAAEWFKNLRNLAVEKTPLADAAERQLALVEEQAEGANLLAALGQDGELFEKLREICLRRVR